MAQGKSVTVTGIVVIAILAGVSVVGGGFAVLSNTPAAVPNAEQVSGETLNEWFELSLTLSQRMPGATPPVVSRALGYLGVTAYETVRPGIPGAKSLAGQLTDLPPLPQPMEHESYDWRAAANAAMARATMELYPRAEKREKDRIRKLEEEMRLQLAAVVDPDVLARSIVYGQQVADAVIAWADTDGGRDGDLRNFPKAYVPPTGPGMWVPTPRRGYQSPLPAMQPTWGSNRPFLKATTQCSAGAPLEYSEEKGSPFYDEALEVYETVKNLTQEQRQIALFWSDDPGHTFTPPGHSVSIAMQMLRSNHASLGRAADTYARIGIAVADAFIGCWREKYVHNVIRPITYIKQVIDPQWNTPVVVDPVETPPFPEYPSGHSVQSGAASTVLTDLFGPTSFTDSTHDTHMAMPRRSYRSFQSFAEEAALSRLYGGIHYRTSIRNGLVMGDCIGQRVDQLITRP